MSGCRDSNAVMEPCTCPRCIVIGPSPGYYTEPEPQIDPGFIARAFRIKAARELTEGSRVRVTDALLWRYSDRPRPGSKARHGTVKRIEVVDGENHYWVRWDNSEGYGPLMAYPASDLIFAEGS